MKVLSFIVSLFCLVCYAADYIPQENWDWEALDQFPNGIPHPVNSSYINGVDILYEGSMSPEKGWELYVRKLWEEDEIIPPGAREELYGTNPPFPPTGKRFFALYNHHTGVLRTFIWIRNTVPGQNLQHFLVNLRIVTDGQNFPPDYNHSLLAYEGGGYGYAIDGRYNGNAGETFVYNVGYFHNDTWIIADTKLAYDPNINGTKKLQFEYVIRGQATEDIKLGGKFDFQMQSCENNPEFCNQVPYGTNQFNSVDPDPAYAGAYNKTRKFFQETEKRIDDAASGLNSTANALEKISDKFWDKGYMYRGFKTGQLADKLKNVASKFGSAIPYVGAAIGVIETIGGFFGLNEASQPTITYSFASGNIDLEGVLNKNVALELIRFHVAGSKIVNEVNKPYWVKQNPNSRLGLFNLQTTPTMRIYLTKLCTEGHYTPVPGGVSWTPTEITTCYWVGASDPTKDNNILMNPYTRTRIKAVKIIPLIRWTIGENDDQFVFNNLTDYEFRDPNYFHFAPFEVSELITDQFAGKWRKRECALRVYFLLENLELGKEFEIVKTYPTNHSIDEVYTNLGGPEWGGVPPNDVYFTPENLNGANGNEPILDFAASRKTLIKGQNVQFNPIIPGGFNVSCIWDFGDGIGSTETNPIHTYPETGEYSVTLQITYSMEHNGHYFADTETISKQNYVKVTNDITPIINLLLDD